jgi:hypothetical protein
MTDTSLRLRCPTCGQVNDAHASPDVDHDPTPGGVSICFRCVTPSVVVTVNDEYRLRQATPAERDLINANEKVRTMRHAIMESRNAHEAIQLLRDAGSTRQ